MLLELQTTSIYIGLAITGAFIGLGNAVGQWIFKDYILLKYKKFSKRFKK